MDDTDETKLKQRLNKAKQMKQSSRNDEMMKQR
jgi:hypothetical protein